MMTGSVKKMARVTLALLISVSALLAGCSKNNDKEASSPSASAVVTEKPSETASTSMSPTLDTSKEVKLKYYFVGDQPKDMSLVWDEINKKLKAKINATIEPVVLGWGDAFTKLPVLFSSGEDFDLIFTAQWYSYSDQAIRGGFKELDDNFIKTYAPLTYAALDPKVWKETKIKDKGYMVPNNQANNDNLYFYVRGDLRQKYNLPEIKSIADFEKYSDTILANEKGMIPYADNNQSNSWMLTKVLYQYPNSVNEANWGAGTNLYYDFIKKDGAFTSTFSNPNDANLINMYKKLNEYKKKGYWAKDAMTAKTGRTDLFKQGKGAITLQDAGEANTIYADWKVNHPDWKLELYDASFGKPQRQVSHLGNGVAINAISKNPERAMMAVDLLGYDPEIHDLILYGIKGKHYDLDANGKMIAGPDAANYVFNSYSTWSYWNWDSIPERERSDAMPGYYDLKKIEKEKAVFDPLSSFTLDTTLIKTELANMGSASSGYGNALQLGYLNDVEAKVKEYNDKVEATGWQKVKDEAAKQIQEHLKRFAQ